MPMKTRIAKTPCGDYYVEEYWEDDEVEEEPIPVELPIPVQIPQDA